LKYAKQQHKLNASVGSTVGIQSSYDLFGH